MCKFRLILNNEKLYNYSSSKLYICENCNQVAYKNFKNEFMIFNYKFMDSDDINVVNNGFNFTGNPVTECTK